MEETLLFLWFMLVLPEVTILRSFFCKPKKICQEGHFEFEMNGWSDTETNPDTQERRLVGLMNKKPGGGFKYFLFSSLFGEDSHFDSYFSTGLVQPPTRKGLGCPVGS